VKIFAATIIAFLVLACTSVSSVTIHQNAKSKYKTKILPSAQRTGDAQTGKEYLINGDFVDSGFPSENGMIPYPKKGDDVQISPFTEVVSDSGVQMIAPNCFQCHADSLRGAYILGLGNTSFDFTVDMSYAAKMMDRVLVNSFGADSKEVVASKPFIRALEATSKHIQTEVVGANPADKLAAVLAAHRNKDDLTWHDTPNIPIPEIVVPADPPAWWLLKKKHAMFTTGVGRGDFARLMMASSLLTLQDTVKAREVDDHFADVLCYVNSLKAPKYFGNIDVEKVSQGKLIFEKNCSSCHGTYGQNPSYPNYLVDIELVKTDSLLAVSNYGYEEFVGWYNGSWFSKGKYKAYLQPSKAYVAPPLDGVWATAPYLHNGSVPTIYHVLNSIERPEFWTKNPSSFAYDEEKLGWQFVAKSWKQDKYTYDTNIPGYGNEGHNFGDKLTEKERFAVIEYLKTI